MTLIKKRFEYDEPEKFKPPEKRKVTFDIVFGLMIILIVMAIVAIFFPMLIMPLLK